MKLEPIIKLTGNSIVSSTNKLTLLLLELFCIPIINKKNKQKLYIDVKNNFFKIKFIFYTVFLILIQTINYAFIYSIFFC